MNGSAMKLFQRRQVLQLAALGGAGLLAGCQPISGTTSNRQTSAMKKTDTPEITHRQIQTNGITMHIAEAGEGFPVVFLHGFPELWYSWRLQLPAIAAAGFHAVAPDQRGYGQTDAPPDIASYSMKELTADVIGLLDALDAEKGVLVGHDWGSGVVWACAELYPERVAAMFHLGIAYSPRGDLPPTESIGQFAGDHFNFALYFQEPGVAEAELEKDVRDTIRRFFYTLSGDAPPGTVEYLFTEKSAGTGMLEGMPNPDPLPAWFSEADLDYYTQELGRTGFRGGLNWYRNMDSDWHNLPQIGTTGIPQPVSYIGGRRDPTVIYAPFDPMIAAVPKLRRMVFLETAGHWLHQERPTEVNQELIEFLQSEIGTGKN